MKPIALKGIEWTTGSMVLKSIFNIAQYVFLARVFSPFDFGQLAIISIIISFSSIFFDIGLSNAIVSFHHTLGKKQLSTIFWLNIFFSLLSAFLLFLFEPLVNLLFKDFKLTRFLVYLTFLFPLISISQFFITICQRTFKFRSIAIADTTATFFGLILLILSAQFHKDIIIYFYGLILTNLLLVLFLFPTVKSHFSPFSRFNISDIRCYFKFGLYQIGERALNYTSANLDKVIIGRMFGLELLGLYNCAFQIVTKPLSIINASFFRVSLPTFSTARDEIQKLNNFFILNVNKITFFTFPIYGFIFTYADTIIYYLYGTRFLGSAGILKVLCLLGAFWSLGNPIGAYLLSLGKANVAFYFNLLQVIIVAVSLILGSQFSFNFMLWFYVICSIILLWPADYIIRFKLSKMSFKQHVDSYFGNGFNTLLLTGMIFFINKVYKPVHIPFLITEIVISIFLYLLLSRYPIHIFNINKSR